MGDCVFVVLNPLCRFVGWFLFVNTHLGIEITQTFFYLILLNQKMSRCWLTMCLSNLSLVYNFAVESFFAHTISLFSLKLINRTSFTTVWSEHNIGQKTDSIIHWTRSNENIARMLSAQAAKEHIFTFSICCRGHQLNGNKLIEIKQKLNEISVQNSSANSTISKK